MMLEESSAMSLHLVVVDNPVRQGLRFAGPGVDASSVCNTAGESGRVVLSSSIHVCCSRGGMGVQDCHLWSLVSVPLDIS